MPVQRLLPCLCAQAVGPLTGVHIKETPFICLFGRPWWQAGRLGNVPNLTKVDGCAHKLVLLGVIVDQLVLDGVQLEPAQLPGLQESAPLVEVALVQDVRVPRLPTLALSIVTVAKAVLTSPNNTAATSNSFTTFSSTTTGNRLILGACFGNMFPTLFVAVQPGERQPRYSAEVAQPGRLQEIVHFLDFKQRFDLNNLR